MIEAKEGLGAGNHPENPIIARGISKPTPQSPCNELVERMSFRKNRVMQGRPNSWQSWLQNDRSGSAGHYKCPPCICTERPCARGRGEAHAVESVPLMGRQMRWKQSKGGEASVSRELPRRQCVWIDLGALGMNGGRRARAGAVAAGENEVRWAVRIAVTIDSFFKRHRDAPREVPTISPFRTRRYSGKTIFGNRSS
jgi:hypothetical protein